MGNDPAYSELVGPKCARIEESTVFRFVTQKNVKQKNKKIFFKDHVFVLDQLFEQVDMVHNALQEPTKNKNKNKNKKNKQKKLRLGFLIPKILKLVLSPEEILLRHIEHEVREPKKRLTNSNGRISRRDLLQRLVPCSVYTIGLVAGTSP